LGSGTPGFSAAQWASAAFLLAISAPKSLRTFSHLQMFSYNNKFIACSCLDFNNACHHKPQNLNPKFYCLGRLLNY
jgi:hypothetical protein